MDLRTGFMMMYPEYRGTRVISARVSLTRVIAPAPASWESLQPELNRIGYDVTLNGDTFIATKSPFTLDGRMLGPQAAELKLWLPIKENDVNRAMISPASLSSETLVQLLPDVPGVKTVSEDYEQQLTWEAVRSERVWFIVRQLLGGAVAVNWQWREPRAFTIGDKLPDAGAAPIPDPMDAELYDPVTNGRLGLHRQGTFVSLRYSLRLLGAPLPTP